MTPNAKASIGILAAVLLVAGLVWAFVPSSTSESPSTADGTAAPTTTVEPARAATIAARPDSRRLTDGTAKVTFVEFLDFECEACGSMFPVVEQLRADYAGRVDFVVRYFPLPNHFNSERAARAVEAAAQQDRFEQMYRTMFERQTEWAEQKTPADDVFRGYARDIGLDLAEFDAAYAAPATLERVRADVADGTTLGVAGTPSFFLDGTRLQPQTVQDLRGALDSAVARAGGRS